MALQDSELAWRCQQGDVSAYAELVRRHRRGVYGLVRAILRCSDEAEDVAQEAFIRGYRGLRTYNRRYVFGGWIRRIAVNCAVTRLRKRERERRVVQEHAVSANPGPTVAPTDRMEQAERRRRLNEAMDELPLKQRLAVTLFHLEDLNLAETAEALGCSVGAVKAHLHRGRRRLARKLAEYLEED